MPDVSPQFSIIIPTFNERDNVTELVKRLDKCLQGIAWEAIFVDDDSSDGTTEELRTLSRQDPRVRYIWRIGRRGLASACVEGMMASSAPYVAVMDADLQHDEAALVPMLGALRSGSADVAVGSRYAAGGSIGKWDAGRARISRFATRLSRLVLKRELADPMSGFFALRREVIDQSVRNLSTLGFKILVDILASSPRDLRVTEVAYEFRNRQAGESKLDSQAMWDYLMLLGDKLVGHIVPIRFLAFTLVGAVGVAIHFTVLTVLFRLLGMPFGVGQTAATIIAMTCNFALNNELTYRDMRLRGWRWVKGLVTFNLVCGLGAFANVGIASYLFVRDTDWILAALAGIVVGAVWNYAVTAIYTWNKPRRKAVA